MSEPVRKLPTAPKATEAYRGGIYVTNSDFYDFPSTFRGWPFPANTKITTSSVEAPDGKDFPRRINEVIYQYPSYEGSPDTIYSEIPGFNRDIFRGIPNVTIRSALNGTGDEYNILKRRFNEAKSVSTPRKQQGGQINMNEHQLQQAFIQFLAQKTGAKNQQELETAIQQMGEQGLQAAYQEFMQLLQQQQVQAAKFGAKLNYIKSLRGQCPEGYEISYYKVGGTLCKKCMKKQEKMQNGGNMPEDPIEQFKCGKKTKKTKKKEEGGELNSTKNPKAFSKMALAKCGAKLKEACKGVKMKDGDKVEKKPKLEPKQKRLNPDSTKTLPGGKYPSYWTPQERMRWERKYGPQDEGAHVSPPTKKKATGGTVSTNKGTGWKPCK